MMQALTVRNIVLGKDMPKVCAPLTEAKVDDLLATIAQAQKLGADLIEWRVDYFDEAEDAAAVCDTLGVLRAALGDTPLIFSFRRKVEGGECAIEDDAYVELLSRVARTGLADLMDIEYSIGEKAFGELVTLCKEHALLSVASYHNFECTPDASFIVEKLARMEAAGAHMPKIAVMAQSSDDLLTLLQASNTFAKQARQPFVAISMGSLGLISRLGGEIFGSAITFAAVNHASAPGQISIAEVKQALSLFHNLKK